MEESYPGRIEQLLFDILSELRDLNQQAHSIELNTGDIGHLGTLLDMIEANTSTV